jgi:hypothetical protein
MLEGRDRMRPLRNPGFEFRPRRASRAARSGPTRGIFSGRWRLDTCRSGLGYDARGDLRTAELDITKDDGDGLAWTLVHEDGQGLISLQVVDGPLDGTPSRCVVDGQFVNIRLRRESPFRIAILTGPMTAPQRIQRLQLINPEMLVLRDLVDLSSPSRADPWVFVRASVYPRNITD